MEITPLAFDSFGARSMATFVETDDVPVLIDPWCCGLGASRYRLPPHPLEIEREPELWQDIKDHAARADILVVSRIIAETPAHTIIPDHHFTCDFEVPGEDRTCVGGSG